MKTKFKSFGNIHTILGILLAMLLVQTAAAQTGFNNEVWISSVAQTNLGVPLGTLDYPYDGSTQSNFDYTMSILPTNTTIHLLAGTYQTYGTGAWHIQTGWKILGSGIDNTIVKLVPSAGSGSCVMGVTGNMMYSNIVVADLTLDASSSTSIAHNGVSLAGSYNTVRNVKVINTSGSASIVSFGIELGACSGMSVNNSEGNLVENCEIDPIIAYNGCGIVFNGGGQTIG